MLLRDLLTNLPNPMLDGVTTLSWKTSHAPAFRPGNASGVSALMNFGLFSMNMGACSHPEDAAPIARIAEDIGPMGRSTDLLLMHSAGLAALRSHAVWFCRVLGDRRRTSRGRCGYCSAGSSVLLFTNARRSRAFFEVGRQPTRYRVSPMEDIVEQLCKIIGPGELRPVTCGQFQ